MPASESDNSELPNLFLHSSGFCSFPAGRSPEPRAPHASHRAARREDGGLCAHAANLAVKLGVIWKDDYNRGPVSVRLMMTRLIYSSKWDPIWGEVLIRGRAGWLSVQWSSSFTVVNRFLCNSSWHELFTLRLWLQLEHQRVLNCRANNNRECGNTS